ncbi:MAG: hypothetical protein H0W29_09630 [Gemmatimonadales bacterium]|nr:hypothetical protein [Gemmatimonadales bacterium]
MLTAMMAVWNMQGARHDVWSVNSDFEYHETQRLERMPVTEAGGAGGQSERPRPGRAGWRTPGDVYSRGAEGR